jgi:hypothetical protein
MERGAVVGSFARELHEVADMVRRQLRLEINDEFTLGGVNDRLLAPHLGGCQGGREEALQEEHC